MAQQPRIESDLQADCANCCGLCCVAPAFDADQGFGYDKPAHEPCRHLQLDDRCAIHAQLDARGFGGCARFTCHGAGQRITRQLHPGRHWRDAPETARAMFDAYSRLLRLHELMAMLAWAEARVVDAPVRERLAVQRRRIDAAGPAAAEGREFAGSATLREETLALLREVLGPARGFRTRS